MLVAVGGGGGALSAPTSRGGREWVWEVAPRSTDMADLLGEGPVLGVSVGLPPKYVGALTPETWACDPLQCWCLTGLVWPFRDLWCSWEEGQVREGLRVHGVRDVTLGLTLNLKF